MREKQRQVLFFHGEGHLPGHSALQAPGLKGSESKYQEELSASASRAPAQHPLVTHKAPL